MIMLFLSLLISLSTSFSFANLPCTSTLPYKTTNINFADYQQWFGKLGQNINGTSYTFGHVFSRHVAVNYRCTSEQKADAKTVFWDLTEFYKTLTKDNTNCSMSSTTAFNFNQNHVISNPSDYIRGIDCKTDKEQFFNSYFVEYKRAIKNAHPTQSEYMSSKFTTVWTFYPKR